MDDLTLDFEEGGWDLSRSGGKGAGSLGKSKFQIAFERILLRDTQGHRISVLITAAFSLFAALVVVLVVVLDARTVQKRSFSPKKLTRPSLWASIHKAEVMPLAIAIASVIQSCIFLAVQSQALDTIWVTGCKLTAQLIWPSLWLVAFTVTAFSLESTFRSLRSMRFEPRGKFHVIAALILIVLFTLATFVTAHVLPSRDVCWGNLVMWSIHFVQPSIALGAGIILVNIVTAVVLITQLIKTTYMSRDERIAASRVVYSLGINVIILALIIPFFICFSRRNLIKSAELMADQVVTLNGLLHGVVHLFIRTNSEPLAIRPRNTPWTENRPLRLFGPNDLNIHDFISTPLLANRDVERAMFCTKERNHSTSDDSNSFPRQQIISIHPDASMPPSFALSNAPRKGHTASSSYSIFPGDRPVMTKTNLTDVAQSPAYPSPLKSILLPRPRAATQSSITVLSMDSDTLGETHQVLEPPKPLFLHKRNDSEMTSQMVEIGIRLSNAAPIDNRLDTITAARSDGPGRVSPPPALISPERYVTSAKLAEAAKSRPPTPPETDQTGNTIAPPKPLEELMFIGLPKSPSANKKNIQRAVRNSIANKLALRQNSISRIDKSLPPVPTSEEPSTTAALAALVQSSHTQTTTMVKQATLPVPNWRQSSTNAAGYEGQGTSVSLAAGRRNNKGQSKSSGWL